MSLSRIVFGLGVLSLALAAPLAAQGLGDTAAREKAKRSAKPPAKTEPAKVFTNEDLAAGRPPGTKPDSGGSEAPPPLPDSNGEAPPPSGEDRLAQERPYLDAINVANSEVTRIETLIRQLSDKLNPMSLSYIFGAGGSNDANEELRVRAELTEAERSLAAARQEVAAANKNLQDFRQGRPVSRPE